MKNGNVFYRISHLKSPMVTGLWHFSLAKHVSVTKSETLNGLIVSLCIREIHLGGGAVIILYGAIHLHSHKGPQGFCDGCLLCWRCSIANGAGKKMNFLNAAIIYFK